MAKQKIGFFKRLFLEFLFWLHFLIAVFILIGGLFINWYWMVLVLALLRAQQLIFHGCALTLLEAREGGIPKGMAYYQLLAKRLFNYRLKKRYVFTVWAVHFGIGFAVTILAAAYNIRIHL